MTNAKPKPPPAARLEKARSDAGYRSARAAALALGWVPSTYTSHENGTRGLTIEAAKRYAAAFGMSWVWLLEGESMPEPAE